MRTDQSVAELAEKLKTAFPEKENAEKIEEVKERARLAFEELEKLEEKEGKIASPVDPPAPVEAPATVLPTSE
jgi:hypothetical protein